MKLATRYFIAFAALTTAAFVTYGTVHAVIEYRRDVEHAGALQRAEARVVATRIAAYLELAMGPPDGRSGGVPAEMNLRYLGDIVAAIKLPGGGRAFIADDAEPALTSAEATFANRNADSAAMALFTDARAKTSAAEEPFSVVGKSSSDGSDVLMSAARIPLSRWRVFVEQPLDEVMAPVHASLYRTIALLALLLTAGVIVSRYVAARLTRPILELERVAAVGRNVRAHADAMASVNEQLRLRVDELALKKEGSERANAAKTRFLAAASHDLRQPMQAISLLVEVLRERLAQQDVCGLVEKVQASVQALESLFVSLLDISRLDAGAVQAHQQEFAIDSLLQLVAASFLPQAVAKGLDLRVVHSQALVRSDPALLERILGNLVSNAIHYTARGRIVVGCRRRGDRLHVLVIDTGAGVPGIFHERIFEEFFQLANPEHDRSKGLGLGLSIVRRTAEILQHPLIVRSEVNRGSTFGVELPLVARAPIPPFAVRISACDRSRLSGTFVVVIDDERENRFAIETLCAQWGCHVVGASSPELALDKLQEHLRSPDLIVADYRLHGGNNGMSAIEKLRRHAEEVIPAIIMTGDMSLQPIDLEPYDRVALLHKPINAEKLWTAADRLLTTAAN